MPSSPKSVLYNLYTGVPVPVLIKTPAFMHLYLPRYQRSSAYTCRGINVHLPILIRVSTFICLYLPGHQRSPACTYQGINVHLLLLLNVPALLHHVLCRPIWSMILFPACSCLRLMFHRHLRAFRDSVSLALTFQDRKGNRMRRSRRPAASTDTPSQPPPLDYPPLSHAR